MKGVCSEHFRELPFDDRDALWQRKRRVLRLTRESLGKAARVAAFPAWIRAVHL